MMTDDNNKNYLLRLNKLLSKLYRTADKNFYYSISKTYDIKENTALIISRRVLPVIMQLFFLKILKVYSHKKIPKNKIKIKDLNLEIKTIQELEIKLVDKNFDFLIDEFINNHIFEQKLNKKKQLCTLPIKPNVSHKNNLYYINNWYLAKILMKLEYNFFRYFPFLKRLPTLHLSQMSGVFYKKGWYLFFLKNLDYDFITHHKPKDIRKRKLFFKSLLPTKFFLDFKVEFKLNSLDHIILEKLFNNFIANLFPTAFLENFTLNFKKANDILKGSRHKILISSGSFSTPNIFLLCAGKERGFKLLKLQHGGYEGYVDEIPMYDEMEYVTADIYFSWGWTKIDTNKDMKIMPMSSPWLSERNFFFKKLNISSFRKKTDVLYLPRKIVQLRATPYGRNNTTQSDLDRSKYDFLEVTNFLAKNKFSTTCKFYDEESAQFYKKFIKEEDDRYDKINFSLSLDKGLSSNMVNDSKLIIWDLPGTGFLECIACNIPTICFSNEKIMQINRHANKLFNDLKNVGVYCENPNDMRLFVKNYFKDPVKWEKDLKRKFILKNFKYNFARIEQNWSKMWMNKIKSIAKNEAILNFKK